MGVDSLFPNSPVNPLEPWDKVSWSEWEGGGSGSWRVGKVRGKGIPKEDRQRKGGSY